MAGARTALAEDRPHGTRVLPSSGMFVCPECGAAQVQAGTCAHEGARMRDGADDLLLGTQIGPYRVARLLGIGGMGRVYKAVHPTIGSRVAIKVLSRECSDRRDLVERFFAEAKAVNVVAHENIVNVLDLATLPDGRPYIVMEYLDGAPLAAVIEQARGRGPLPLGAVARLAAEVLEALGAAHAKGIIHRDLKPDNIYVSPAGRAKVLDFGIAKLQPELGGSSTHTGSLLGTPHYMSPEQAAGKPVDARADVYAIGVILFECVTLQKPFVADSLFELLRKHIEAPPPLPRALRPDLPPELEAVILQALAKQPDQRFNSAHAMSLALQHATSRLAPDQWAPLAPSIAATNPSWAPTPPASWGHRSNAVTSPDPKPPNKRWLWLAGAVVLAGGGITAAVIATSGTHEAPAVAAGSDPPPPVTADAAMIAQGSDVWAGSATPPPPPPPVRAPAGKPDEDAEEPDDFDDMSGMIIAQALDQAKLPSGVKAAIKKYGSWAKVPAKEKKKLATEIAGYAATLAGDLDVLGDDAPKPPRPPAAPGGDPASPPDLSFPGWNAKRAEPDKVYDWAIAQAKKYRHDAQLTRIDIDGVFPDGHADLTLASLASLSGDIDVRFISPSHANHAQLPKGVRQQKAVCEFRVDFEPTGVEIRDLFATDCDEGTVPRPRCTLAKIWTKALAKRPDLKDHIANVTYYNPSKARVVWSLTIRDEANKILFSEFFADDC